MNWLLLIAALLSGFIGSLGLGGGGVLLIYLTVIGNMDQLKAAGINLLFFLPIGLVSVVIYSIKRLIVWKTVFKMWLGGLLGVALGSFLAHVLNQTLLSKIFSLCLIAFGLMLIFKNDKTSK